LTAGVSVPRAALEHAVSKKNLQKADIETKALFSIGMAMEMGWAALEPFIFATMEVEGEKEQEAVREYVRNFHITFGKGMSNE